MLVDELVAKMNGDVGIVRGDADSEIHDIVIDSRQAGPGKLFVALKGARFDAHRFVPDVIKAGVGAILVAEDYLPSLDVDSTVAVLSAPDTRAVLGPLASALFGDPTRHMKTVGITGTNGKTTSTYLLEWVLNGLEIPAGVIGTVNYRWPGTTLDAPNTTPESLVVQRLARKMSDDGVEALVMEVSSHGLETHRVDATVFDVAVFTNFTQDHLDFHGSMEAYRDAKARLFLDYLPVALTAGKSPVAVINIDDVEGRRLVEVMPEGVRVLTYGRGDADLKAVDERHDAAGFAFDLVLGGKVYDVNVPMVGDYNVSNVLGILGAVVGMGGDLAAAVARLADFPGVPGRLQLVRDEPRTFVDYAHTPDALERSLDALKAVASSRVSVVFGCGGDRDQGKRPLMGAVASKLADTVYVTSDNPRHEDPEAILDDIVAGIDEGRAYVREVDRQKAIERALSEAAPEDIVLVAGKGHETYQEVGDERRDFDDREVVQRWGGA